MGFKRKTNKYLLPSDFGDVLSLISIFGFIAIFFKFSLDMPLLSEITTPVFLILGGVGLLISGQIFTIHIWMRDGIQPDEYGRLFSAIFGICSIIIGVFILFGWTLPQTIIGWVGLFAIPPAIFIAIDYIIMNTKGCR